MAAKRSTREKILGFLQSYREGHGYAPTLREIAGACAVKSLSAVQYHLDRLEQEGVIRRDRDKSRSITLSDDAPDSGGAGEAEANAIPVLGAIAAGHPVAVPDADTRRSASEWVEAPFLAGGDRPDVYALRVRGNSMVDALIGDGDIVIMQAGGEVRNGDVAACWLKTQQEVTLKKVYFERDMDRLQPGTPYMMPMYEPADNVEVQGRLIGVIRRCSSLA
jgi:repressor LexA